MKELQGKQLEGEVDGVKDEVRGGGKEGIRKGEELEKMFEDVGD